jgi:hypothetical protein
MYPLDLIILKISTVDVPGIEPGTRITYSPRDPRFVSSNLPEVDGFFLDVKILSTSLGGDIKLRFQAH